MHKIFNDRKTYWSQRTTCNSEENHLPDKGLYSQQERSHLRLCAVLLMVSYLPSNQIIIQIISSVINYYIFKGSTY